MIELLKLLSEQLIFFLDPHGYTIVGSQGTAIGNALIDLKRGELTWRLLRDRSQVSLECHLAGDPDHVTYSTDILKRWFTGERDHSADLLSPEVAQWVREHLGAIEDAFEGDRRAETIAEMAALKRLRSKDLFG